MRGQADPDALWKPGFTGEVVHPTPPGRRPTRPGSVSRDRGPGGGSLVRRTMAVGLTVVSVGVVVGLMAAASSDGDEGSSSVVARIPVELRERWSTTLDVNAVDAVTAAPGTVLAVVDWKRTLVALDAGDGRERWRVDAPDGQLAELRVIDGVVVLMMWAAGDQTVEGLDLATGEHLWTRVVALDAGSVLIDDNSVVVTVADPLEPVLRSVAWLDVQDGTVSARVMGGDLSVGTGTVQRHDGHLLEVYDRASATLLASVDTSVLAIGDDVVRVMPTDAGVVVVSPASAWLLDGDGQIEATANYPDSSTESAFAYLDVEGFDRSGSYVSVIGERTLTMLSISDNGMQVLWQRAAWFAAADVTSAGGHVAIVPLLADPASDDRLTREPLALEVVGADDGLARWSGLSPELSEVHVTPTGFVAGASSTDGPDTGSSDIAGYAFDGTRLWTLAAADVEAATIVTDGLVVYQVSGADATTTITMLGSTD